VPSLLTDLLLLALKFFTARRVLHLKCYLINETRFRHASRDQRHLWKAIIWRYRLPSLLRDRLIWAGTHGTFFETNPDRSPVGLHEEVCTLNSRPLTFNPLESENLEALTPNRFLVGNSTELRERGSMEST